MSPTIPIRGRNRAAGLPGCVLKKSSTSSLMMEGNSSIGSEVIHPENGCGVRFGLTTAGGSSLHNQSDARTLPAIVARSAAAPDDRHRGRKAAAHIER